MLRNARTTSPANESLIDQSENDDLDTACRPAGAGAGRVRGGQGPRPRNPGAAAAESGMCDDLPMSQRKILERLAAAVIKRPFTDELGHKGWFQRIARARPHIVCRHHVLIEGWPRFARPLRIAFLTDLHAGSHTGDTVRLTAILAEAASYSPDLVLFGGDYVNMQYFGRGRLAPRVIAALMARLDGAHGRFAILGNHDYIYGEHDVAVALRDHGVMVLDHERRTLTIDGHLIDIVGVPDAPQAHALLASMKPSRPALCLAHDPAWFAHVPAGPYLTLAGHTHGGQIRLPGIGVLINGSAAPLRWSHGLIVEGGRQLYVSAGLGMSGLPIRNVPPEYAVLDVNGAP
jgi:uncharacterized protein